MNVIISWALVFLLIKTDARSIPDDHCQEKHDLLSKELHNMLGGKIILNHEEKTANNILMKLKREELHTAFHNPQYFNFSKHYFTYKNDVQKSNVYRIIKRMPKGAVLHVHSTFMLNADDLVRLTYEDHLYSCYTNDQLTFYFSNSTPTRPCRVKWRLISDLRQSSGDTDAFDSSLRKYFTMYKGDSAEYQNQDINTIWEHFNRVYFTIKSLISYRPIRERYWYEVLKKYYEDNVMYIEIRAGMSGLYELDGTQHDKKYMAQLYRRITREFMKEHPDFIGVKLILTKNRAQSILDISQGLKTAKAIKKEMPDFIAGFDLVGQEDLGRPLKEFVTILSEPKNKMDYFFHAGETSWWGVSTDENLADAILLGPKRIGHGYALPKHPVLMDAVKKKDIAIEVNVVSNNVLGLVTDVRDHPLAVFLASNVPVVISSDDPCAWDAEPLSTDFFVTFMGVASAQADLRMLKQLALNSIKYSALDADGTSEFYRIFNKQWNSFIKELLHLEQDLLRVTT